MFNQKKNDSSSAPKTANINSVIGEDCQINGDLICKNSVKIDGKVQGNLEVGSTIILGKKSVITGDVRCANLTVFGQINGNIFAQVLHLKDSANIKGNIETHTLQIEPGAVYQGNVLMQAAQKQLPPVAKDSKDR